MDSCHSGGFAVLASCEAEQFSGFDENKKISLYTSFVCDALTSYFLMLKNTIPTKLQKYTRKQITILSIMLNQYIMQDKKWWYRSSKNTIVAKGVHIDVHDSYELIKSLKKDTMSKDDLIKITREYLNNTITEEQLIDSVAPLNIEISKWLFKQSGGLDC